MNRLFKTLVISATIAASTLVSVGSASADEWGRHHYHGGGNGDAVAAGVAGLAVGALLGGALAQPRVGTRTYIDEGPVYDEPAPVYQERTYVYRPAPVYRTTRVIVQDQGDYVVQPRLRPWSRQWMRYCTSRYRSFDPGTGTFIGNDGREHFCAG